MLLKIGVNTSGVQAPTWYAVGVFDGLYVGHGCELVVTSLTDGIHPDLKNIHGRGFAADLRIASIPPSVIESIVARAKEMLFPKGFDVVLETDHIHVEYDPKPTRDNWLIVRV